MREVCRHVQERGKEGRFQVMSTRHLGDPLGQHCPSEQPLVPQECAALEAPLPSVPGGSSWQEVWLQCGCGGRIQGQEAHGWSLASAELEIHSHGHHGILLPVAIMVLFN